MNATKYDSTDKNRRFSFSFTKSVKRLKNKFTQNHKKDLILGLPNKEKLSHLNLLQILIMNLMT